MTMFNREIFYNNRELGSKTPYHSRNVKLGTNEIKKNVPTDTDYVVKKENWSNLQRTSKEIFLRVHGYTLHRTPAVTTIYSEDEGTLVLFKYLHS